MASNKNLIFITGNTGKFEEAKAILPDLKQLKFDLDEIQEMDPKAIIEHKLNEASKHFKSIEFNNTILIVEDTSLMIEGLNGFPGPLIKWYLEALGCHGIYQQAKVMGNTRAKGMVQIGCLNLCTGQIQYFSGEVDGYIVEPNGNNGFGWDPLFQPDKSEKTFGEMNSEEKSKYNMRVMAFEKVRKWLDEC